MTADALAQEIVRVRREDLQKKITQYPRKNAILSDIGDCQRQMVYSVLDWDKKPLHDEDLQARFEVGNLWEREIVRELQGLGFKITLSQLPVIVRGRDGEIIATGRIDGFIGDEHRGNLIPFEIKSMAPNVFNGVKTLEDLQKKPWLRKYTRQLQMYMFGNNVEQGLFIFTDCLGHWKVFPVYLDYGECEAILQKLERVHAAIKAKTYPDRIPYDQSICGKCQFAAICLPDVINRPADFIDNPELENDLDRHEELKPLASEYTELHDKIKETFHGIEKAVVGTKYIVQSLPSQRTTYELPPEAEEQIAEIKQAHAKKVPVMRLVIQKLDGKAA